MTSYTPLFILCGGGTGGALLPVLAVAEALQQAQPTARVSVFASHDRFSHDRLTNIPWSVHWILAGKWRRYWSLGNMLTPLLVVIGFLQSLFLLLRLRPQVVFTAGSFVGVPVIWAAWLLRIPRVVHQQDLTVGLAGRLTLPLANHITSSLPELRGQLPRRPVVVVGNPLRQGLGNAQTAAGNAYFAIDPNLPLVVVSGGGTGSQSINQLVRDCLPQLTGFCQVVHLTGKGKLTPAPIVPHYQAYEFLDQELFDLYAAADLVITRAGFSTLAELSALGKAMLLIPLPHSPQIANATYWETQRAALVMPEPIDRVAFTQSVRSLCDHQSHRVALGAAAQALLPTHASSRVADILLSYAKT